MTEKGSPMLDRPIADVPLAILDVETTGLSPEEGHRICEIAIVRVVGDVEIGRFATLVNPEEHPDPSEAFAVNGLRLEDLRLAPTFAEVGPTIWRLLRGVAFVAHNAQFDLVFLDSEYRRLSVQAPRPPAVVDTYLLAKRCFLFRRNSLAAIAAALDVRVTGAHRAMADALTARYVLTHFIGRLQALSPDRPLTLGDVLAYQTCGRIDG